MGIWQQLTEKPWEPRGHELTIDARRSFAMPAARVGLIVFLAVATVLFLLLIVAYADRMVFEDWRPTPQQWLLWLNTALLVVSSAALEWASIGARRGRRDDMRLGLLAGGGFAIAFIAGQLVAWRELSAMVVFDITNPAIAFFYLITALHGLHLMGGLVAWGRTLRGLARGADPARTVLRVRLCATYWHYLLVLWLVLFGLLFSGDENLAALLEICGLR
jgi:cytochrome c oxidase subunit 3